MKIREALLAGALAAFTFPASGALFTYAGTLSGANENPPTGSSGTGTALVTYDDLLNTLRVQVTFSGLTGNTTASHIHCCVPLTTVATTTPTFAGFPLGVKSGTYDNTLDLTQASSYNPVFVTLYGGTIPGAEAVLLAGLNAGTAYLNVHSSTSPSGELRANLVATPEPDSLAMMGAALASLLAIRRRHS